MSEFGINAGSVRVVRWSCCEICDRNQSCGVDCGSCCGMTTDELLSRLEAHYDREVLLSSGPQGAD